MNFAAVSLLSVIVPLALCELYYIKSSPDQICPAQPCLMLSDFIHQTRENYSQDAISISLLPGNHSMHTDMHIKSMATFVISSTGDQSYNVMVSCKDYEHFFFFNVSKIEMSNIQISGCHVFSKKSNLTMENCNFHPLASQISDFVLVYATATTVRIKHCSFVGIMNGTILYGKYSNVTISHSVFKNNKGRILKLIFGFAQLNRCEFESNECLFVNQIDNNNNHNHTWLPCFYTCHMINVYKVSARIQHCTWSNNSCSTTIQSPFMCTSLIQIINSIYVSIKNTTIKDNVFTCGDESDSIAMILGIEGYSYSSNIITKNIVNTLFVNNRAWSILTINLNLKDTDKINISANNISLVNNSASDVLIGIQSVSKAKFHKTNITNNDGFLQIYESNVIFSGGFIFSGNNGRINFYQSHVYFYSNDSTTSIVNSYSDSDSTDIKFGNIYFHGSTKITNNYAKIKGGGFSAYHCGIDILSGNITIANNRAERWGGGINLYQSSFNCCFECVCTFSQNYAQFGGGIYAEFSGISFEGNNTWIVSNSAVNGGGIFLASKSSMYCITCIFNKNRAQYYGGGIFAIASDIRIHAVAEDTYRYVYRDAGFKPFTAFYNNEARKGGAVFLKGMSRIIYTYGPCDRNYRYYLMFGYNIAYYGAALFIDDYDYHDQKILCASKYDSIYTSTEHSSITKCFLSLNYYKSDSLMVVEDEIGNEEDLCPPHITMHFRNNTAHSSGAVVYGGYLDRCTMLQHLSRFVTSRWEPIISGLNYLLKISNIVPAQVSSPPLRVCYCDAYYRPNCYLDVQELTIQRGETFLLAVAVVDQANNSMNGTVYANFLSTTNSKSFSHNIYGTSCKDLEISYEYGITPEPNQLALYALGPCNDTGISRRVIQIHWYGCPCPIGFSNNDTHCVCECDPKLPKLIKTCTFETQSVLRENYIWIGHVNTSKYSGYLFYPNCPFDYCLPGAPPISINLNIPNGSDAQCAQHRTGTLCGRCKPGYSMSLGGTVCLSCPKKWPGLLVANILAQVFSGILLVGLILMLNITVAVGTMNGLFFYADVVAANRNNFLPFSKPNFLTVFVAGLNLDLGIDRCYVEGMDAYVNTWVSLIYPTYIISLVVLVIFISERSTRFSRIIAKGNPVATLATLILISYTKILKTIISILSFAVLQYPDGSTQIVWLTDAHIKYVQGKHIPLFLTAIAIVILGITYTVLLFSWQWLLRAPSNIFFAWTRNTRLNSFMDAYLAPYKLKHRYWTGLLLFVRVVLYLLSAVNLSGDPSFNLLVIGIVMAVLILIQLVLRKRIYKSVFLDRFETATYINLLVYTIASYYCISDTNKQKILAIISTSVAFIMFTMVLNYHVFVKLHHLRCFNDLVQSLKQKIQQICKRQDFNNDLQVNLIENTENTGRGNTPTSSVVSLKLLSPEH